MKLLGLLLSLVAFSSQAALIKEAFITENNVLFMTVTQMGKNERIWSLKTYWCKETPSGRECRVELVEKTLGKDPNNQTTKMSFGFNLNNEEYRHLSDAKVTIAAGKEEKQPQFVTLQFPRL